MKRSGLFVVLCVVAIAAIVSYIAATTPPRAASAGRSSKDFELISSVPDGPLILFRHAAPGDFYGRLGVVRLPLPAAGEVPRMIAPISCDWVHYASGRGVCMVADESRLPVPYYAYVFDRSFREQHRLSLTGPPIRVRVAPGGHHAALTVFEQGHSYADQMFSTRTIVIDTATGRTIADLEDLPVTRNGRPFKSVDFNFWGVTFEGDGDGFYVTLKTGNAKYLAKGSLAARRMEVIHDDVECPSLSPDGRWIAFKKPLDHGRWRLTVLEVATGAERALNQSQPSVDDQVDWFDSNHVVYHDSSPEGMNVWRLSIDGVESSRLLLRGAWSPAVER